MNRRLRGSLAWASNSRQKAEAGRLQVQEQAEIPNEFYANQGYFSESLSQSVQRAGNIALSATALA